ncbi:hypothetical protein [Azohydromonas lata]|uniref:Uncharacterized protein n=1 Tax=Azohydromonas lata TaxID=45677 RepID=A0ABU5ID28_9BURK|nr:hypothetical protein [Azohydromonas lata]MDZ5457001.1 hypothetical protein [Azohydromonas lata]
MSSRYLASYVSHAASPGAITGTGLATLDQVAAAGGGMITVSGTGAATLNPIVTNSAGAVTSVGQSAAELSLAISAAAGAVVVSGAGAAALNSITAIGTGTAGIAGEATAALDPVTTAGSGATSPVETPDPGGLTGTGSTVLAAVITAGAGTVGIAGHGAAMLQPATVQGSGTPVIAGTAAAQLAAVTTRGIGTSPTTGLPDRPAEGCVRTLPRVGRVRGESRLRRAQYTRTNEGIMAIGNQHTYDKLPGEAKTWGIDFDEFFVIGERDDTPIQASIELQTGVNASVVGIQGRVVWFHVPPGGAPGHTSAGLITLQLSSGDVEQAQIRVRIR